MRESSICFIGCLPTLPTGVESSRPPSPNGHGKNSPKMSRIEPMNRRKTSNTQHPTSNNQWFPIGPLIGGWVLDVGCWMLDVPKGSWKDAPLRISFHLQGLLQKLRQVGQN